MTCLSNEPSCANVTSNELATLCGACDDAYWLEQRIRRCLANCDEEVCGDHDERECACTHEPVGVHA